MDKYGLIGYPLGHSFSISYFNEKFANEHIDAEYINFEIPTIDDLQEVLASTPQLKGLNVTISTSSIFFPSKVSYLYLNFLIGIDYGLNQFIYLFIIIVGSVIKIL